MSPESVNYFVVAEKQLSDAERALRAGLYEIAARESYLVALRAARAIIFDETGNAPKTHSGARAMLGNLKYQGVPIHESFLTFLGTGFDTKSDLDYGPYTPVQKEVAEAAVVAMAGELLTSEKLLLERH